MRLAELIACVLLYSSAGAASDSPLDALKNEIANVLPRQDQSTSFDLSFTGVQGNTATTITSSASDSGSTATDSNTGESIVTGTDSAGHKTTGTVKQAGTGTSGGKSSSSQKSKTFDARLPAGGVSMITPNAQSTSYYKISQYITFAWNYTSLSVTPSAIDILASCSKNQATYTLALNQSVQETQSFTWDTGAYQATATVPLLTETYTLIIHDAAQDVTARAAAGYLATYDQFTFGMYIPQPYTPIADYVCATCNSAMSLAEKQTYVGLAAMVGLTVLSFTWFTGMAGLW